MLFGADSSDSSSTSGSTLDWLSEEQPHKKNVAIKTSTRMFTSLFEQGYVTQLALLYDTVFKVERDSADFERCHPKCRIWKVVLKAGGTQRCDTIEKRASGSD